MFESTGSDVLGLLTRSKYNEKKRQSSCQDTIKNMNGINEDIEVCQGGAQPRRQAWHDEPLKERFKTGAILYPVMLWLGAEHVRCLFNQVTRASCDARPL
jgi:hypothetical protein